MNYVVVKNAEENVVVHAEEDMAMLLLLFATTRSVFKSVKVSVVEIAKRTN